MNRQQLIDYLLDQKAKAYDDKEGMLAKIRPKNASGYHTSIFGRIHGICETSDYAVEVLMHGNPRDYAKAMKGLQRVCQLQDVRQGSRTFGLWPYHMEESLENMKAPDYNWADFVGKGLIAVCAMCGDKLPVALRQQLHQAIRNAMECSIRRNVAADYTNISIMSSMTLISAGELLEDSRLFELGKQRLRKLIEYTRFNGEFSEYNSSAYVVTDLKDIARMLTFFRDEECRAMAEELNRVAWRMLASHYNTHIGQLTPPQMRAYRDVDNGALAWIIWLGTGGKFGKEPQSLEEAGKIVTLEELCFPPCCPAEYLSLFEEAERFEINTFYKKNNIRTSGEDVTIIRELDSPDLTAYSYQTPEYSMGAFGVSDCWNQRRNVMVIWDKEQPKSFRLRCLHNGYDFCSGMVYAQQDKNRILGQLGLATDRGSYHYILDKDKGGAYDFEELVFRFELGGCCENVKISQNGNAFTVRDGDMMIRLTIDKWMFDDREGEIALSADGHAVELIGYRGASKQIDLNRLGDTCGVFTLSVREENAEPVITKSFSSGKLESSWGELTVKSDTYPVSYRQALGLDQPEYGKMQTQIHVILEKMKGMESDGTVEETCPISIISMDAWEWPQGVALFAMYQYYRESGDKSVLAYLKNWFDRQIEKGLPPQNINTTCPMLTLACIYEEERDEKYLPLLQEWLEGVMHRLPRTPEGGLQHIVSGILNEGQLWDDTLYMSVLFLARMGKVLNNESYIQESIRQFMVHIKYLSDVKTGLFFHGWTFEGNHHFANALWGRGNSWYTAGLVDYLECLEGNEGVKQFLLTTLKRQVDALETWQDESGLWHTILDDDTSYLETSASCAFAYGILKAVRMGYLPQRYARMGEKAVRGVMAQIAEDGTVGGVSYGTPVFSTIQEYKDIPICPMPYGQSMALMMLVEAYRNRE